MLWASIEPHDHFGLRHDKDIVFTSPAVRLGGHSSQLSLWLYHMTPATARRSPSPKRPPNSTTGSPSQRLDLHYLITPQATDVDKNLHLIEIVLRTFFAQPVFVLETTPAGRQELRLNPRTETALERTELWRGLGIDYQLAAAYDVSGLQLTTP